MPPLHPFYWCGGSFFHLLWVSRLWSLLPPSQEDYRWATGSPSPEVLGSSLTPKPPPCNATHSQWLSSGGLESPDPCVKEGQTLRCKWYSHAAFGIRLRLDFSQNNFLVSFLPLIILLLSLQYRFLLRAKPNKSLGYESHSQALFLGNPLQTGTKGWSNTLRVRNPASPLQSEALEKSLTTFPGLSALICKMVIMTLSLLHRMVALHKCM